MELFAVRSFPDPVERVRIESRKLSESSRSSPLTQWRAGRLHAGLTEGGRVETDRQATALVGVVPEADTCTNAKQHIHEYHRWTPRSMSTSGYEVVDEVSVGGKVAWSEWKTVRAEFRNFAELPSARGVCTSSPVLKCHGLEWAIECYAGGNRKSSEEDVHISMFFAQPVLHSDKQDPDQVRNQSPVGGQGGRCSMIDRW